MKKILSFFVAGALALGLIGCSGDLHDYEANEECIGLYLAGDIQTDDKHRAKLTFVDETTQTYTFTYDSSTMTHWGGSKGTINFKLVTDAETWTQDFGWKKDTPVVIDMNGDFLTLEARDAANSNPGNIKVENLIDGKEYVITVNYDAPNKVAKVKIAGPAIDFPTLKVVTNKTEDGNPVEYPLTRDGTTYKYIWTPTEAGSFKFYVTNGYMYYGKDGKIGSAKPAEANWAEVIYEEAGKEYGITVETAYDKGSDVTIEAGIYDTSILAKAGVIGTLNGWTAARLKKVDDTTYIYDFTTDTSKNEFSIQEVSGDWNVGRWFGGIEKGADADRPEGTLIAESISAAKKGETAKKQTPTYYKGDAGASGKHIKITGLPYKEHRYRLTATIVDADKKEISLTVQALEDIPDADFVKPAAIDLTGYGARGLFGEWSSVDPVALTKQTDGTYTLSFTATASESDCKIANGDWNAYPLDADGNCQNFTADDTEYKFYPGDSGMSNPKLSGMTVGSEYIMTVTPSADYITVKVSVK